VDERLHITIDTREQRPWAFPPDRAVCTVQTLVTGDYALTGDAGYCIERKSLDDFVGCLGGDWRRFQAELHRMVGNPARPVIIEASLTDCCFRATEGGDIMPPAHSHPRMSPAFVAKRIAELTNAGVALLFCDDRGAAAAMALAMLHDRAQVWRATR
jgi:hypothetical protein